MRGKTFIGSKKSYFDENKIQLLIRQDVYTNSSFLHGNEFLELLHRVMVYLKFDGYVGKSLTGSGKLTYHTDLRRILTEIQKYQPNISSMSDLEMKTIEYFIDDEIQKNYKARSTYRKLYKLLEWSTYANNILPPFLQIDRNIINGTKNLYIIENKYRKENKLLKQIGGPKEPYDLKKLKKLVATSIHYLEMYSEDIIEALSIFQKVKKTANSKSGAYAMLYNLYKESKYDYSEPSLLELKTKIDSTKSYYSRCGVTASGGKKIIKTISNINSVFLQVIRNLEACCHIVILMTTGMRTGEYLSLERYPEITDDEHLNLKRVVYKTSATEEGDVLDMPIPLVTKLALETLSSLSANKDGKKDGKLVIHIFGGRCGGDSKYNVSKSIQDFASSIGIDTPPTPHQFRHAMAFLITYTNQKNGIDLAKEFLGHDSTKMTLQYMGHFNVFLKRTIREVYDENSSELIKIIGEEIKDGKKLYGPQGERLMGKQEFVGSYVEEFTDLLTKGLMKLVQKGELAIIQTPVCLCIHDLTKPEEMACQRGFNIVNFIGEAPMPSRCEGISCGNSVFTEESIENIQKNLMADVDPELRKRMEKNSYFMLNDGFEDDPYERLIKKYLEDKKRIV